MAVRTTDWCSPGFMRQGIPRLTSSFPNDLHTKIKKLTNYLFFNIHLPPPKKKIIKISHAVACVIYFCPIFPQANRPYSIPTAHSSCPVMVVRLSDRRCGRTSRTWLNCWRRAWRIADVGRGVPLFSGLRLPIKCGVSSWPKKTFW